MIRFKFLIVISVCLVVCSANAQSASVIWDKYFGGQNGEAMSIAKASDGGYIVAGTAQNPHEEAVGSKPMAAQLQSGLSRIKTTGITADRTHCRLSNNAYFCKNFFDV